MKLPEPRIRRLMAERDVTFLKMGKRTMREWALVKLAPTAEIQNEHLELLREAMRFASS